ncbi:MAG: hypothetical protein EXS37_08495 [Opitutus sp.]|nr:hypothetical protein [Opitutus sp.]
MSAEKVSSAAAKATRNADRRSNAGSTPDPWEACVALEYGGDRSFAWSVREELISTPPEGHAVAEDRLLKALALPSCTDAGRQFLCQMIVLVGSAKSVPALATLLRNPSSTEAARYALAPIPGPEAFAALRDALGALTGESKAGLIGSIALRGDTAARPALAAIKDNSAEPAIVREAATRALEHLATAKA